MSQRLDERPAHVRAILARLKRVKPNGTGWIGLCPAHEDIGDDNRIQIHCFAFCAVEDILLAVGLQKSDLFPTKHHCGVGGARRRHITTDDLARDKMIPVECLRRLGLADTERGVSIAYKLEDGALAPRQRVIEKNAVQQEQVGDKQAAEITPQPGGSR